MRSYCDTPSTPKRLPTDGLLSKPTHGGLVIGVMDHGERRIFSSGTARPDSILEIGSVTKTFTALILAQMVVQQKLTLDEPVRALLPAGFDGFPRPHEMTLLDLATHTAGLPQQPLQFGSQRSFEPLGRI